MVSSASDRSRAPERVAGTGPAEGLHPSQSTTRKKFGKGETPFL